MTIKEMYRYKGVTFLREESPTEVNYYYLPDGLKGMWENCTQYDFLQAKYYGIRVTTNNILIEQKESIK